MQETNDRYTGQTQVKTRSIWRSPDGQTELFAPANKVRQRTNTPQYEAETRQIRIAPETVQQIVKYGSYTVGGGLTGYAGFLFVAAYWHYIVAAGAFFVVVCLASKLVADRQYRNQFSDKQRTSTTQTKTTSGQTIIHNHYYN